MDASIADIAAVTGNDRDGFGNWSWIIALLIVAGAFNGNGLFGGNGQQAATAQEILFGQQFQNLDNKIDRIGNGIADATFALNNSVGAVGAQVADCCCTTNRNIDQARYDNAIGLCGVKENDNANTQKILDLLYQNKIEALQGKVNQLELQSALCGVVRYPNQTTFTAGPNPYFGGYGTTF